jgi:hypothetical protein
LGDYTSQVEPPRFTLHRRDGGAIPEGVAASVVDGQHVVLTGWADGPPLEVVLAQPGGDSVDVTLAAGQRKEVSVSSGRPYPLIDLALGRTTFPTDPLPIGMSDPTAAVDDVPGTAWVPGDGGRMVVDIAELHHINVVELLWSGGPVPFTVVEISTDGRTYTPMANPAQSGERVEITLDEVTRYVAVSVPFWTRGQAVLAALRVF